MGFNAGAIVNAGDVSWDADLTALTDETPTSANTWVDYGTETVTFSDPGVSVIVLGFVTTHCFRNTTNSGGSSRVGISLDGGSTYTFSTAAPRAECGNEAGGQQRASMAAMHLRTGDPSGTITVKAQVNNIDAAADSTWFQGSLMALMIPVA